MSVECRRGVLVPHGRDLIAAESSGGRFRTRLLALDPRIRPHQTEGDEKGHIWGFSVVFPSEVLSAVAAVMKPRKTPRKSAIREVDTTFPGPTPLCWAPGDSGAGGLPGVAGACSS